MSTCSWSQLLMGCVALASIVSCSSAPNRRPNGPEGSCLGFQIPPAKLVVETTQLLRGSCISGYTAGNITWTSATPTVATIDPTTGLTTAVGEGTTVITATVGRLTASATVEVTAKPGLVCTGRSPCGS